LDALNNIGLRSGLETNGMKSASGITSDKLNSREATRIPPPARFEDRFRVYNKGLSGKKHFSK
ncbi:MAG: hypothetical protein IKW74_07600, partial [Thermoguttaceae bacterium]|nr:hypothetical protein [Thermoguttaceae bacterium]